MKNKYKIDQPPEIVGPPSARHIPAPEVYESGAPADDFSDFKEDFDQGSWTGTGITCVLPGGGTRSTGKGKLGN